MFMYVYVEIVLAMFSNSFLVDNLTAILGVWSEPFRVGSGPSRDGSDPLGVGPDQIDELGLAQLGSKLGR